jgi:hypothetical protein
MTKLKTNITACCVFALLVVLVHAGCSSNENAHTTATTIVPPPPRQVLKVVRGDLYAGIPPSPCESASVSKAPECVGVDPRKPLLVFDLPKTTFGVSDVVAINFAVRNAKLRGEGGEFRIRYIIDDDDARWSDSTEPFGLSGWLPGRHTIRLELIGPDGWPYRNGNQNIITREITVQ